MCRDHHIAVVLDEDGVYVHSGDVDKENKIGTAVPKYGLYEVDKEFFVERSRTRNIIDSIKKANCAKQTENKSTDGGKVVSQLLNLIDCNLADFCV